MDINGLLETAKKNLENDKWLTPVLFIETEKDIKIIGLIVKLEDVDKREMMMNIGKKFAREQQKKIQSLSFISEANISRIKIGRKDTPVERYDAIVIAKLNIDTNEKEIVVQDFERSNDNIIFKDIRKDSNVQSVFLLEAFMEGYYQAQKDIIRYNK